MSAAEGGLFRSLKGFVATGLEVVHTRLELLATEMVEERVRLGLLLAYAAAAVILLAIGVLLGVTTLAVLFWEQRVALFAVATALFLGGGVVLASLTLRQAQSRSRIFSASLAELSKDRAALNGSSDEPDAR